MKRTTISAATRPFNTAFMQPTTNQRKRTTKNPTNHSTGFNLMIILAMTLLLFTNGVNGMEEKIELTDEMLSKKDVSQASHYTDFSNLNYESYTTSEARRDFQNNAYLSQDYMLVELDNKIDSKQQDISFLRALLMFHHIELSDILQFAKTHTVESNLQFTSETFLTDQFIGEDFYKKLGEKYRRQFILQHLAEKHSSLEFKVHDKKSCIDTDGQLYNEPTKKEIKASKYVLHVYEDTAGEYHLMRKISDLQIEYPNIDVRTKLCELNATELKKEELIKFHRSIYEYDPEKDNKDKDLRRQNKLTKIRNDISGTKAPDFYNSYVKNLENMHLEEENAEETRPMNPVLKLLGNERLYSLNECFNIYFPVTSDKYHPNQGYSESDHRSFDAHKWQLMYENCLYLDEESQWKKILPERILDFYLWHQHGEYKSYKDTLANLASNEKALKILTFGSLGAIVFPVCAAFKTWYLDEHGHFSDLYELTIAGKPTLLVAWWTVLSMNYMFHQHPFFKKSIESSIKKFEKENNTKVTENSACGYLSQKYSLCKDFAKDKCPFMFSEKILKRCQSVSDVMTFKNIRHTVGHAFHHMEGFLVDQFELKHIVPFAAFMYIWNAFANIWISSLQSFYGLPNIIPSNHNPLAFLARALEFAKLFVLLFCGEEVAEKLYIFGEYYEYDSPGIAAIFSGEANFGWAIANWVGVLLPLFSGLIPMLLEAKFYKVLCISLGYAIRKINKLTGLTAGLQKLFVTDYDNKKGYLKNIKNNWKPFFSKMTVTAGIFAFTKVDWWKWAKSATTDVMGIVAILVMFDFFKPYMWVMEYNGFHTTLSDKKAILANYKSQFNYQDEEVGLVIGNAQNSVKLQKRHNYYFMIFWTLFTMMMLPALEIYGPENTLEHIGYEFTQLVNMFGVWGFLGLLNGIYAMIVNASRPVLNENNPIPNRLNLKED